MNGFDIFLVIAVVFSAYRGYTKGLLMEVVSLAGILLGLFLAFKLIDKSVSYLREWVDASETFLSLIAIVVVFVAVVVVLYFVGRLLKSSLEKTLVGSIDKALGAVVGIFKVAFIISFALWIMQSFEILPKGTEKSVLYPYVSTIAPAIAGWMGITIPSIKNFLTT